MLTRTIINTKLEWHVQSVVLTGAFSFKARKIMNTVLGLPDQLTYFVKSVFTRVRTFTGYPWFIPRYKTVNSKGRRRDRY